jgi:hypothetical protein
VVPAEENPHTFNRAPVQRHYTADGRPKHELTKLGMRLFKTHYDAIKNGTGSERNSTQYGQ